MDAKTILSAAFHSASKSAGITKQSRKFAKERRHIEADLARIRTAGNALISSLETILSRAEKPNPSDFENELLKTMLDLQKLEKTKKQIHESIRILRRLMDEYEMKAKYSANKTQSNNARSAFYGRASSVLKRIDLQIFEEYRRALQTLPRIRKQTTIIICGAPNVGKSQILRALSGHNVKIANYPFTTQEILVGYLKQNNSDIQLIDTPGLLDRSPDKRNEIERRAIAALQFLSNKFLFVLDPSETCGFGLESQQSLMQSIKKMFKCNMLVVATKKDLPHKTVEADFYVNALDEADVELLKQKIFLFLSQAS